MFYAGFATDSRLNIYFCVIKFGGTFDFPCNAFRGKSSKAFRAYATVLCIISFGFTIQSMLFLFVPTLVPENYVVLTKEGGQIAKLVLSDNIVLPGKIHVGFVKLGET